MYHSPFGLYHDKLLQSSTTPLQTAAEEAHKEGQFLFMKPKRAQSPKPAVSGTQARRVPEAS